tara:strand:+ start:8389 stop:8532 length:144 start_codon:yes stop_codon:yes gene_type:complete
MNDFELRKTDKEDHYRLFVNGVDMFGEHERSIWRHLIQSIDNKIYQY